MPRHGERVEIEGVGAWYSPRELEALRELSTMAGTPASVWPQIRIIHGLKAHLGATIVDAVEEASIRRAWTAAEQESAALEAAGQAPEKAGDLQPDYGSSVGPRAPQSALTVTT